MSQSLAKQFTHIIFSTKHRQPLIQNSVEDKLHAYLYGICKKLECHPVTVGGYTDHIHILCLLSKKIALMKLLETLKSNSSSWMKTQGDWLKNFYWQDGYGAFSVSPSEVEVVANYIANQKEHHRNFTYQEEFRVILKKQQVEYDERYVWD